LDRHLNSKDRQRIVQLYEGRLAQFGYDVRTLGWGSKPDQWLRFSVLCRGLDLSNKRILDVGCGFGDFVEFLCEGGHRDFKYVGVDIAPGLVKEAQRRHGGRDLEFIAADILEEREFGEFDIVVSSGALSFHVSDNMALAKTMLAKMFGISREVVAVNFLSSYVDYQLAKNFHYQPETIFSFARSLTRWVCLYHDYPLYEFTLQMLRSHSVEKA
jgi:SAM-dependent methyltransferase